MRVLTRYDGRRCNAGVYQNWVIGKWYPIEVLPRLEVSYNQAVGALHITAGWLAFEIDINVFGRRP
jgi:hypothetical protein